MGKLVGIVGGAGAEGSHFAEILQKSGLEIAISDTNTKKAEKLCAERKYTIMHPDALAQHSDLVLFSLPIDVTVPEIERLAPQVKGAMADLTSVKQNTIDTMVANSQPETEVFSIHAMYRPTVSPWGQNVLFIPARPKKGGEWCSRIQAIMKKRKANVSVIESGEKHDELSMVLQVLPHTVSYAYLQVLSAYTGVRIPKSQLQQYSTLFSRGIMEATGRLVSDPNQGRMYGLIQKANPKTGIVYDLLIDTLKQMKDWAVNSKDPDSFANMHKALNQFLGDYAKEAASRIDQRMGHPLGLQLVFESEQGERLQSALGGFEQKPAKYKEYLNSVRIPEGALAKLHRNKALVIAKQAFYKQRDAESEGTFAFYITNRRTPEGKRIRFSPVSAEDIIKTKDREPDCERVQMTNRFNDPFLNLFSTWKHNAKKLEPLGHLVAYSTYG
jgi:prephenate dehydrogenase